MGLGILCIFLFNGIWCQDTVLFDPKSNDINQIQWVGKFPSENNVEKTNLFQRIGEFFIGKKEVVNLTKPISVLAENPESFWVMDQSIGSIIEVQDKVAEIPNFMKEKYNSLVGICATQNNQLFFSDSRANNVYKVNLETDELVVFSDSLKLDQPTGIAYSQLNDEVWVVETAAHRISVLNARGELVKQFGNRGEAPGEFNFPTFIWIDKYGMVYIVDSMNFRIQILNDKGEVINCFGQIGDATGYFARPKGIATDSFGNIYIADALFHVVQIFDKNGNFLYHFGQQGREDGQFWMPSGLYIDENDYIYVADSYNSRIQVFQLNIKK